jgi:hypothetical protein
MLTSTAGSYIEIAAGINVGGQIGLSAAVVTTLFIACLISRGLTKIVLVNITDIAPQCLHNLGNADILDRHRYRFLIFQHCGDKGIVGPGRSCRRLGDRYFVCG